MKAKKFIATLAIAGVITAGGAGAAFAADGSNSANGQTPAGQVGNGHAAKRHPLIRRHIRRAGMKVVADTLGVSAQDLRTALMGGQSISQYATSLGKNPQDVVTALVKAADARIDKAVADGKLDAGKAAAIKAEVTGRVDKLVNRTFGQPAAASPQPAS
ncbi:MAG TPA: hypothetical protein VGA11_01540 [Acidimicrobiia bacterium]